MSQDAIFAVLVSRKDEILALASKAQTSKQQCRLLAEACRRAVELVVSQARGERALNLLKEMVTSIEDVHSFFQSLTGMEGVLTAAETANGICFASMLGDLRRVLDQLGIQHDLEQNGALTEASGRDMAADKGRVDRLVKAFENASKRVPEAATAESVRQAIREELNKIPADFMQERLNEVWMNQVMQTNDIKKVLGMLRRSEERNREAWEQGYTVQSSPKKGTSTDTAAIQAGLEKFRKTFAISTLDVELPTAAQPFFHDGTFEWFRGKYLGDKVVIKRLKDVSRDSVTTQYFVREVIVLARVPNPSVLRFYGAVMDPKLYCIVHENVEDALVNVVESPNHAKMSVDAITGVVSDLSSALKTLHNQGVYHGSLSLSSIVVCKTDPSTGRIWTRLTGFGFSMTQHSTLQHFPVSAPLEDSNTLAPERFEIATSGPSSKSDVFSCGLVFWLLLAWKKRLPAWYKAQESAQHLERLIREAPSEQQPILRRCLAVRAEDRLSASDLQLHLACNKPRVLTRVVSQSRLPAPAASELPVSPLAAAEQQLRAARASLERAAAAGDTKAAVRLALMLQVGLGGQKDDPRAIELLNVASAGGDSEATFLLGMRYISGDGVSRNIDVGIERITEARRNGYRERESDA